MSDIPIHLPSPFSLQCPVLICLEVWLMDYARTAIVPEPNTFEFTDSFGTVHAVSFDKDGYAAIPDVSAGPGHLVYKGTLEELAEACGYTSDLKVPAAREQNKLTPLPHGFALRHKPQNMDTYEHKITYPVLCKGKGVSLWVDIRAIPCTRHVIEVINRPCRWEFAQPWNRKLRAVHFAITNADGMVFSSPPGEGTDDTPKAVERMRDALAKPWPPKNPKDYAELCSNISGTKRPRGASDFFHLLHSVNKGVNEFVKYTAEPAGQEDWQAPEKTLGTRKGDCEDYALLKYALLRERGVSEENMRILAHRVEGIGHAILLVYDQGGDTWYRLDNYEPKIYEKCKEFKGIGYDPDNTMTLVCKEYAQPLREQ